MYFINKISSYSAVDYAAEELRKYLRMMMPECGNIEIKYAPEAKDGFRLGLMQDLLYKFHMDTFSFSELSFLEFNVLVSYIFAFLFGGLLIFSFLKIGSLIAKNAGFLYSHNLTKAILIAFMALYLVVAVIFMISGNPLLSVKVHNWAMPLLAFFGGFCMYSIRNH